MMTKNALNEGKFDHHPYCLFICWWNKYLDVFTDYFDKFYQFFESFSFFYFLTFLKVDRKFWISWLLFHRFCISTLKPRTSRSLRSWSMWASWQRSQGTFSVQRCWREDPWEKWCSGPTSWLPFTFWDTTWRSPCLWRTFRGESCLTGPVTLCWKSLGPKAETAAVITIHQV